MSKKGSTSNKIGQSNVHTYYTKPAHNAKYYKYFLFKFKSSHTRRKKALAPVQGVRYNSRPAIHPQSHKKKVRQVKQIMVYNNQNGPNALNNG